MFIDDLYVEDIVKGMSENMGATVLEKNNVTSFEIPKNKGKGFISATQFASGLGIIVSDYQLKETTIVKMEKDKINPLRFVFNLGDSIHHKFDDSDDYEEIKKFSGAIIGSSLQQVHSFKLTENKDIKLFSIELNRNLFNHKIRTFKFELSDDLKTLLNDVKAENPFFCPILFGSEDFEMIRKIIDNTREGFIGSLYKEGITYSILSNSLENYLGDKCDDSEGTLTDEEIDIILKVSNSIEENLGNLPTIDEIANHNFISESKLQKLFKNFYNCSVNDFTRKKRMQQARALLENTEKSISEIADELGIRSNSYFSKIFKERYGVTPSDYRGSRLSKIRMY